VELAYSIGGRLKRLIVAVLVTITMHAGQAQAHGLPPDPPVKYWYALAKCETGWGKGQLPRWHRNTANYEGGLGIHRQTWNDYTRGDKTMPDRGGDATIAQQITVALRVVHGWGASKGVGYYGWGCAKHSIGDPTGRLANGKKSTIYHP